MRKITWTFVRVEKQNLGAHPKGSSVSIFASSKAKPSIRYRGMGVWEVSPATTRSFQRVLDQMQGLPGVAAAISQPPMV